MPAGDEKEDEQLPVESIDLIGSLAITSPVDVVVVTGVTVATAVTPASDTDASVDVVLATGVGVDVSVDTGMPRVTLDTSRGVLLSFSGHDTQGCTGTFS